MVVWFCAGFVAAYYIAAIVQALLHRWLAHRPWLASVFDDHVHGHHALYPAKCLLQDRWLPTPRSAVWRVVVPLCVPSLALACWVPSALASGHLFGIVFAIASHAYLHRQYHAWNTPLARFAWFRRRRALHCVHHHDPQSNFALVESWIDTLAGTRRRCP